MEACLCCIAPNSWQGPMEWFSFCKMTVSLNCTRAQQEYAALSWTQGADVNWLDLNWSSHIGFNSWSNILGKPCRKITTYRTWRMCKTDNHSTLKMNPIRVLKSRPELKHKIAGSLHKHSGTQPIQSITSSLCLSASIQSSRKSEQDMIPHSNWWPYTHWKHED